MNSFCSLDLTSSFIAGMARGMGAIPVEEGDDPRVRAADTVTDDLLLLGVTTASEATRGFRRAALKAHPDKGGRAKDFLELSEAKERLEAVAAEEAFQHKPRQTVLADCVKFGRGKQLKKKKAQSESKCERILSSCLKR